MMKDGEKTEWKARTHFEKNEITMGELIQRCYKQIKGCGGTLMREADKVKRIVEALHDSGNDKECWRILSEYVVIYNKFEDLKPETKKL